MKLIAHYSYQGYQILSPLTNIVFWAGAGFSKAWEPASPVGSQLFALERGSLGNLSLLDTLIDLFGTDNQISFEQLRQLLYQLDMYDRYPDLRSRYFDDQNICMSRNTLRQAIIANFNKLSHLNYFDATLNKFPLKKPSEAQRQILKFFNYVAHRSSGADAVSEGLRMQFITTNYDFVIETILDNFYADPEDSLFLYTYRGFTPTRVANHINPKPLHDHWLVWHLLKLNGGFEIVPEPGGYVLDYSKRAQDAIDANLPVLMLPSREQNYLDPYFRTIFPKAVRLLRESAVLVLIGYSLPADDALIRFIIRQFAEEREDGFGKYLFYIDPLKNIDKLDRLSAVFPWAEDRQFPQMFLYEGGFSEFAKECVTLIPRP
jgi:SIR2-like domain